MFPGPPRRRSPAKPIVEFWTWWPSARARLTPAGLAAGGTPMAAEISNRVKAIHPRLEWELGRGSDAQHAFMLSCAGRPEARAPAARWLALAPPADDTWEFHDARRPNLDFATAKLRIDGRELAMADSRFGAESREYALDITLFHPILGDLPQRLRVRLAQLCVVWALGEHAVEVWVGDITVATSRQPAASPEYTVEQLRALVTGVADRHAEPRWASLTGETADGHETVAAVQVPLRSARWPRFDVHVAVTLPFAHDANGLPTAAALEALRSFEDMLTQALESDGALLAHETRDGTRTFHYYADADALPGARLATAAGDWPRARAYAELDPTLLAIRHLDAGR